MLRSSWKAHIPGLHQHRFRLTAELPVDGTLGILHHVTGTVDAQSCRNHCLLPRSLQFVSLGRRVYWRAAKLLLAGDLEVGYWHPARSRRFSVQVEPKRLLGAAHEVRGHVTGQLGPRRPPSGRHVLRVDRASWYALPRQGALRPWVTQRALLRREERA